MKNLIFALCFLIIGSIPFSAVASSNKEEYKKVLTLKRSNSKIDFTYELVFKDGIWWIYVYDEDGNLIVIYPNE